MVAPDFSTWHAVRSADRYQLFRIETPGREHHHCVGYVRGVIGDSVLFDIPFGGRTERRTYKMYEIRKD